jgi:serine/threonine-protein kinase
LTTSGSLKVLDFGIATLGQIAPPRTGANRGQILGTPGYMSPEQACGARDRIDARTDVWGIGATMFRLLTGRPVHQGATPNETLKMAATREAPALAPSGPPVPAALASLVDRALRFSPDDRFQTALEMRSALRALKNEFESCALPSPRPWAAPATLDETAGSAGTVDGTTTFSRVARYPGRREPSASNRLKMARYAALTVAALAILLHGRAEPANRSAAPPESPADKPVLREAVATSPLEDRPVVTSSSAGAATSTAPWVAPRTGTAPKKAKIVSVPAISPNASASPMGAPAMSAPEPTRLEDVLDER